ncbi:uncharacterized protein [Haliotis asinina]|uniref:uncharacterized protein isoform X1 n=2 Tax=Haliotis asinina TaxID=109174 RepID=UPI0035324E27
MSPLSIKMSLLLLLLMVTWTTDARIGFKKDLSMDAVFPAPIRRDAGLPEGHLRPLGYQRPADSPAEELDGFPDIRVFYHGYSKQRTPVVFRKALKDEEVFKNWEKDKYLRDTFGKLNITVVTQRPIFHKDEIKRTTQVVKMKRFLSEYEYEDWYISSVIPAEIQQQLSLPTIFNCGVVSRYLQKPEIWMSSGSISSKLHSHHDHNLHCVLFGRRDYVIIRNKYRYNFDFKETYINSGEGYSPIDMENINVYKHKKIKETPWTWATLRQGDCILIPSGYLHYVHAYGRSISYSILFSPTSDTDEDVDEPPCKKGAADTLKPMSEGTFTWSYDGGKTRLTDRQLDADSMRHHLMSLLRDDSQIYFEKFDHFYKDATAGAKDAPPAQQVFDIFKEKIINIQKRDKKRGLNYITRVDIHQLSDDQLMRVANIFNNPNEGKTQKDKSKLKKEELQLNRNV